MDLKEAFDLLNQEMGAHGLIDLDWTAMLDDAKKRFGLCRMGQAALFVMRLPNSILIQIAGTMVWWVRLEGERIPPIPGSRAFGTWLMPMAISMVV